MRERPILFNTEMVQAILEGRKTQTRRMVKNHEICECGEYTPIVVQDGLVCNSCGWGAPMGKPYEYLFKCPLGQVGDRLWVRENFRGILAFDNAPPSELPEGSGIKYMADGKGQANGKVRPSIHMPRWISRIMLEITDVRVERLQEITPEDSWREGIGETEFYENHTSSGSTHEQACYGAFWDLWDSIYKNWYDNPWVWVVEFKVVEVKTR